MYSFAEHLGNLEEQFNNICEKYWDEGGEEYSKRSNPLSAINGPVRVRFASESEKKIGYDDTIEIRTPDSNPLLTLGFSYTEILHWLISKSSDYGMRFSNKPKISFDGSDIVLPNNWLLKYLSNKTLKNGLDDDVITDYCLSILNSADKLGYTNSEVFNKLTDNIFDKKGFNYSLKDYKNSGWFFNENEKICCFVRDTVRQEYDDLQKML